MREPSQRHCNHHLSRHGLTGDLVRSLPVVQQIVICRLPSHKVDAPLKKQSFTRKSRQFQPQCKAYMAVKRLCPDQQDLSFLLPFFLFLRLSYQLDGGYWTHMTSHCFCFFLLSHFWSTFELLWLVLAGKRHHRPSDCTSYKNSDCRWMPAQVRLSLFIKSAMMRRIQHGSCRLGNRAD